MTKPLSNAAKVNNLKRRIDRIGLTATNVKIDYFPEFREIALSGDGFLSIKGIMSEDGTLVKITKCPGFHLMQEGKITLENKHPSTIVVCDFFCCAPISFRRFENICRQYKKAWLPKLHLTSSNRS